MRCFNYWCNNYNYNRVEYYWNVSIFIWYDFSFEESYWYASQLKRKDKVLLKGHEIVCYYNNIFSARTTMTQLMIFLGARKLVFTRYWKIIRNNYITLVLCLLRRVVSKIKYLKINDSLRCNYIIVKNRTIDVVQQKNQKRLSLKTRTPHTCTSHVFDTFFLFKSCVFRTENMETRNTNIFSFFLVKMWNIRPKLL